MAVAAFTQPMRRLAVPVRSIESRGLVEQAAVARELYVAALRSLAMATPERCTMTDTLREIRAGADAIAMVEAQALAKRAAAGASDRSLEKLASETGLSKSDAKRTARRAKAVAENSGLAGAGLSAGQLDVIAESAARTDGAAAIDQDLIAAVGNRSPDQGRRLAREWENRRRDLADVESEHDYQHTRRSLRRWITNDGAHALMATGSRSHIDLIWQQIEAEANRKYRADGGRDLSAKKHPRTRNQRLFDAFHDLVSSQPSRGSAGSRPVTVVTVGIDRLLAGGHRPATADTAPSQAGELIGSGALPDSLLATIIAESDVVGLIFGRKGELLWQGRRVRNATVAQWLALVVRDGGCVLCGAAPSRCAAHHLMPWDAPGKGPTNLDNLALVCADDHQMLHQLQQTLVQSPDNGWITRPATRDEIAPHRPARE